MIPVFLYNFVPRVGKSRDCLTPQLNPSNVSCYLDFILLIEQVIGSYLNTSWIA